VTASVTSPFWGRNRANLDLKLQLQDGQGRVLATADPATVPGSTPGSLSAALKGFTPDAGRFYIVLAPTGWGDPKGAGYSSYGSLGGWRWGLLPVPSTSAGAGTGTRHQHRPPLLCL
jgi:hypothetical protein